MVNECGSEVRFDFKCRWMMNGEGELSTIEYRDGERLGMRLILNEDIDWIVELRDNGRRMMDIDWVSWWSLDYKLE